jgi:phosphohistidine phosphatase SixA
MSSCAPRTTLAAGSVIFLVRHAEKVDGSRDAELSDAGRARAELLADTLANAKVERVHSTEYRRAVDTAKPLAERLGVTIERYDPRGLPKFVETLQREGGRHLIVGHSNTVPVIVEMFGGDPGPIIDEAAEFDRLYVIGFGPGVEPKVVLQRYGAAYRP